MSKEKDILKAAEEAAAVAANWADLSNALFDPVDGLVAKAYPTREDRAAFVKSDAYRQIQKLISDARGRTGLINGSIPTKSGRFVVRVPKSMHAALEQEASAEGVSLNQLVVAKLAIPLDKTAAKRLRAG
jgi:hypothetical protein